MEAFIVTETFAAVMGSDISIIELPTAVIAGKDVNTGAVDVIGWNECYSRCLVSPSGIHVGGLIGRTGDACCWRLLAALARVGLHLSLQFYAAVPDSEMIVRSETWRFDHLVLVGMAVEIDWLSSAG